jgi:hypothetical protein
MTSYLHCARPFADHVSIGHQAQGITLPIQSRGQRRHDLKGLLEFRLCPLPGELVYPDRQ